MSYNLDTVTILFIFHGYLRFRLILLILSELKLVANEWIAIKIMQAAALVLIFAKLMQNL